MCCLGRTGTSGMLARETPTNLWPSLMMCGVIHRTGCKGGETRRGWRAGQGIAPAFFGEHPGDLGEVNQAFGLADADHAPALDPGVPLDRGGIPERHPRQRERVGAGDQPVPVLASAVGIVEPPQVGLVHGEQRRWPT
jgi:hypothetical protein